MTLNEEYVSRSRRPPTYPSVDHHRTRYTSVCSVHDSDAPVYQLNASCLADSKFDHLPDQGSGSREAVFLELFPRDLTATALFSGGTLTRIASASTKITLSRKMRSVNKKDTQSWKRCAVCWSAFVFFPNPSEGPSFPRPRNPCLAVHLSSYLCRRS